MACSPWSSARDRKKASMGMRWPRGASGTLSWSVPWKMARSRFGGIT